jgi:hypothetical protein
MQSKGDQAIAQLCAISYASRSTLSNGGAQPPCDFRSDSKLNLKRRKIKTVSNRMLDSKVGCSDLLDRFGLQVRDIGI